MSSKETNDLLDRLHEAVNNTDKLDEAGRRRLRDLEQDIRAALDEPTGGARLKQASEQLKSAIEEFEVSHPILTELLSEASTILSNAGI